MCGIVGYIGPKEAIPILVDGLKRLEYRGYDSAGIALLNQTPDRNGEGLLIHKKKGKIRDLEQYLHLEGASPEGDGGQSGSPRPASKGLHLGLGHTRWATHGKPDDQNAHPHKDCSDRTVVVHNGIIENYGALKRELLSEGHHFTSQTDTEVIAHLIEREMNGDLTKAVRNALKQVEGSYAIGVMSLQDPERIVAARKGSPLILGCGDGENFIASDVPAILPHTREVIYLDDEEMAVVYPDRFEISSLRNGSTSKLVVRTQAPLAERPSARVFQVRWDASMAEKCGYKHFMLKEIHEQPRAIRDTFGRYINREKTEVHFDDLNVSEDVLKSVQKIFIVACGTSYHAALIGKLMIERYAQVPVEVDIASEFRYRSPMFPENCLTIAVSQSGETADTLAAIRLAKENGSAVLSVCNVLGSTVTRESHGVIYTNAGPEIGVASTKAFTTQVAAFYLFCLYLASVKGKMSPLRRKEMIESLCLIPAQMEDLLKRCDEINALAQGFHAKRDFLYLGRSFGYPIALEGALKLKEISYIHAEGYSAGEMKHGPIALIDAEMPVVVLAPKSGTYDKLLGNVEEVKARGGSVIAIATQGDDRIGEKADHVFYVPEATEELSTLLMAVPLQLLAYFIADCRGCDIDQPRNLAKSVTVE